MHRVALTFVFTALYTCVWSCVCVCGCNNRLIYGSDGRWAGRVVDCCNGESLLILLFFFFLLDFDDCCLFMENVYFKVKLLRI